MYYFPTTVMDEDPNQKKRKWQDSRPQRSGGRKGKDMGRKQFRCIHIRPQPPEISKLTRQGDNDKTNERVMELNISKVAQLKVETKRSRRLRDLNSHQRKFLEKLGGRNERSPCCWAMQVRGTRVCKCKLTALLLFVWMVDRWTDCVETTSFER